MKKLYSYDNFEGDKGIIVADSMEEAEKIYKAEYPERKIIKNNSKDFHDGGCFLTEAGEVDNTNRLYNIFPW